MALSFRQRARAMFPGLPAWIINDYGRGLAEYDGNAELAWNNVRQDERYDTVFAGNRRADGSLRMSELEYLATKDAYRQTLRDYGLAPDVFEDKFGRLVEGDVSVNEFATRLDAVHQGVMNNTPEVQAAFQSWYGAAYNPQLAQTNPSVALAMALDPDVGNQVLSKRITFAQISGEAARQGFQRNREQSQRLAELGVDQGQARQIYSQAAQQLPSLTTFSERFNDDDLFDLDEFEDAALGDARQQQRAQRLLQAEQASFSGSRRVAQDQTGGLSGLRQR